VRLRWFLLIPGVLSLLVAISAYVEATARPIVREARVALHGWPKGAEPVRAVLISDIHVGGPDMPPARLAEIVEQINALRPDVVLIAGDLITDKRMATRHYSMAEAIAPLARLTPRLGSFAVLGNHDHWRNADAARAALKKAGVKLLENDAAVAGPLVIGGLDDDFTGRADLGATLAAMGRLKGAKLMLSHSPDPFADLPGDVALMVAGHTHCGQIALPGYGALKTMSRYGRRFACGIVREGGKTLLVSAGLGTSGIPFRFAAPPDMWLIELGPRRAEAR
jgi:predicted MPP superfamily phosphohydrolase